MFIQLRAVGVADDSLDSRATAPYREIIPKQRHPASDSARVGILAFRELDAWIWGGLPDILWS
jgi:hypothetical protein